MLTLFLFLFVAVIAWLSGWMFGEYNTATVTGERDKLREILLGLSVGNITTKQAVERFYDAMGIVGIEVDDILAKETDE